MVDYIKSKSIKEYLKQEKTELSDLHKAALILRTAYPMGMIHASLMQLADKTKDEKLKRAIEDKIKEQHLQMHGIMKNESSAVFGLEVYEPEEKAYRNKGYYNSFETAEDCAHLFSGNCIISKHRLYSDDNIGNYFTAGLQGIQTELGSILFDTEGNVLACTSNEYGTEAGSDSGYLDEDRLVMKHPFRKGDIVKNLVTGDTGVVNDCEGALEEWMEQKENQIRCDGAARTGLLVEYADPAGNFCAMQTFPYDLEFAEVPENNGKYNAKWELLKEAEKLLKGNGSLEEFSRRRLELEARRRWR